MNMLCACIYVSPSQKIFDRLFCNNSVHISCIQYYYCILFLHNVFFTRFIITQKGKQKGSIQEVNKWLMKTGFLIHFDLMYITHLQKCIEIYHASIANLDISIFCSSLSIFDASTVVAPLPLSDYHSLVLYMIL